MCQDEIGQFEVNIDMMFGFNNETNWEELCDHIMRKRNFTLNSYSFVHLNLNV